MSRSLLVILGPLPAELFSEDQQAAILVHRPLYPGSQPGRAAARGVRGRVSDKL